MAQNDWGWLVDYASDNLLLPLDDFMRTDRVRADEWYPGQMDYSRLNGKYYGLPTTGHANLLYFNRELFQKAGVPLPPADHTWRWNDLLAAARRLTRRVPGNPQESQWGLIVDYGPGTGGGDAIWQNGGTITDTRENPTRTTLDATAQDGIQWLLDLRHRHQVVPSDEERKALGRAWSGEAAVSAAVQEANEQGTRIIRERAQRR